MNDYVAMNQEGRPTDQEDKTAELPGAMLKAAREREGLSVAEVAKTLYMTRAKLRALESDDYDQLNSDVFIQGYLRRYGPLVGLDGDSLVDRYQKSPQRTHSIIDQLDERDEEIPKTLIPKIVVPAILFGLLALVLITVFVFSGGDSNDVVRPDVSTPVTFPTEVEEAFAAQIAANEIIVNDIIVPIPEAGQQNVPATGDSGIEISGTSAFGSNSTNPESLEPELKFEFSEDCWIEVRNKLDEIIYSDIATAGEKLELHGEPPFSISLGNARAVTLYWGDEFIAVQPRRGGRTAKLTVGE